MLCEINNFTNFWATWAFLSLIGLISVAIMSGIIFKYYYMNVSYENWRYKSNPIFPKPEKVKEEII